MVKSSNFILIGFKRSGKTTLGRTLAGHFGLPFIDTDSLIAPDCNAYHKEHGKEVFRRREVEVIQSLKDIQNTIIAVGAGAICNPHTAQILKQLGQIFYLYVDKEELRHRFKLPPVPAYFEGDFDAAFENMYKERAPLYEQIADKVIFHEEELWQAVQSAPYAGSQGEN